MSELNAQEKEAAARAALMDDVQRSVAEQLEYKGTFEESIYTGHFRHHAVSLDPLFLLHGSHTNRAST